MAVMTSPYPETRTGPSVENGPSGLRGARVLIIGASRGVGAASSKMLGAAGCSLLLTYRVHVARARSVADEAMAAGAAEAQVAALDMSDAADRYRFASSLPASSEFSIIIICASGGMELGAAPDYAARINTDGPQATVISLLERCAPGATVVYVTSHEAHFYGSAGTRPYSVYDQIARSKHAGEDRLLAMRDRLDAKGIGLKIVSADLIDGSYTAKILERLDPGMIERRRAILGVLPTSEDVAREIVRRCSDRSTYGHTTYVWTPDNVTV